MIRNIVFLLMLFIIPDVIGQCDVNELTLNNFRPESVYNIPVTTVDKPAFPIIDMHSHDYTQSEEDIEQWVRTMEKFGIEKAIILSTQTGAGFDSVVAKYSKYPQKFEIWCGFDFTGYNTDKNWTEHAVKELERCHQMGAKGVGELGDKGEGLLYSKPTQAYGLHIDDDAMIPLLEKCAELNMPVNVHIAEPIWMYEKMDSTNDGLMNGYTWRVDLTKENILDHGELIQTLDNALGKNPGTTFIACHFANCSYDLQILGNLLDKHDNLRADISARYAETAPIPRYMKSFYEKYQDKLVYGTDMGFEESMYQVTFRILETADEHFYEPEFFNYHWSFSGFDLSDNILKKLYKDNALSILNPK